MIKNGEDILDTDYIIAATAGEALSANDALYISTADGKAYKTDADDLTKMDFVGFAQEAASSNGSVSIEHQGTKGGFSGLTIGAPLYVSGTAGGVTSTPPTNVTSIGVAISATVIRINWFTIRRVVFTGTGANTWNKRPGLKYIEVEVQGGGGDGGTSSGAGDGGSASGGDINITGASGGEGHGGTGSGAIGGNSFFSLNGAAATGSTVSRP